MIRAAIIGMGHWGHNLVQHIQGKSELIQFVAGATRTPSKAQEFAKEFNLRLFDSFEAALDSPDIDAVVLATPHSVHAEQIIAAAKKGKHIFTEKPLGLDTNSAQEAANICINSGVILSVGYNWRFQPALQEIHRLVNTGVLGKILHIEGNFCGPSAYRFGENHWRQNNSEGPAGGMTGRGVHVLDAMIYLSGHIEQVSAQSFRLAQNFGNDDTTSMLMRFKNGSTAYLGTVIATAETWRMQILCEHGWAEVGGIEHLNTWDLKVCLIDRTNVTNKQKPSIYQYPQSSTELAELNNFAKAIVDKMILVQPDGDAVHNVAVLDATLNSAKYNTVVKVL